MMTTQQVADALKQKFPHLNLKVVPVNLQLRKENCFGIAFYGEYDDPEIEIVRHSLRNFSRNHLKITPFITHIGELTW